MDQKQDAIIALLAFIAVLLVMILNPAIRDHADEILIAGIALIVGFSILKAIYEIFRDWYWSVRKFIDQKREKIPY